MFHLVDTPAISFQPYHQLLEPQLTTSLAALSQKTRGTRIVHLNSTAVGGGVAEILRSLVPISKGLGLDTDWYAITPPKSFFDVTKKIHNLLQGAEGHLSTEEMENYIHFGGTSKTLDVGPLAADVLFLHDPQLLPLMSLIPEVHRPLVVWVCHIDLSTPNIEVLEALLPYICEADALVFSMAAYIPSNLGNVPVHVIPPAIDPLSVKNRAMPEDEARNLLANMGVDPHRPLVTQVSRFDPWKDPWGVVDAYKEAKKAVPELQLAYLGAAHAVDDPEGKRIFDGVTAYAGQDKDIHLFGDSQVPLSVVDKVVNAYQTASSVILQKSIREGFGLTVTEAMWKGKPVIGGNVGGIRTQIQDGINGFLVDNASQCADRIVQLFKVSELRGSLGKAAKESVKGRFLLPRLIRDYLQVLQDHVGLQPYESLELAQPSESP